MALTKKMPLWLDSYLHSSLREVSYSRRLFTINVFRRIDEIMDHAGFGADITNSIDKVKKVKLVYFSGTGSTTRVADMLEEVLSRSAVKVQKAALDASKENQSFNKPQNNFDLLIIVFAVHAFDAPQPVYNWLNSESAVNDLPAAVISVSGGGEVWPNTACRFGLIHKLDQKGFKVFYERMIVMPSNWIVATHEQLAFRLLKILPDKIEDTVSDIVSGVSRRSKPQLSARFMAFIFKLEKPIARLFAKDLKVSPTCTGCGWCAKNCPQGNIDMKDQRPSFGWKCVLCLRCLYGCPQKALLPRFFALIRIKEGYNLDELARRMPGKALDPIEKHAKGYLYAGVKDYLLDLKA